MKIIAIQIDNIKDLTLEINSSPIIGLAAQELGYSVFFYYGTNLSLKKSSNHKTFPVSGYFSKINTKQFQSKEIIECDIISEKTIYLEDASAVFLRKKPPFNVDYLTSTYILEILEESGVLVLNSPKGVRNCSEKISAMNFESPDSFITSNANALQEFAKSHEEIVLKPMYEGGGTGVIRITSQDQQQIKQYIKEYKHVIAQPFISHEYDKRIIILDNEVLAAFKRFPAKGDFRTNTILGGTYSACSLTNKEQEICNSIKILLKENNIWLAGIDVLNEKLIEINVTSPTGLRAVSALYKQINVKEKILNSIASKISS